MCKPPCAARMAGGAKFAYVAARTPDRCGAGLRAMTAPAAVAWGAHSADDLSDAACFHEYQWTPWIFTMLAVVERTDQLPTTPVTQGADPIRRPHHGRAFRRRDRGNQPALRWPDRRYRRCHRRNGGAAVRDEQAHRQDRPAALIRRRRNHHRRNHHRNGSLMKTFDTKSSSAPAKQAVPGRPHGGKERR